MAWRHHRRRVQALAGLAQFAPLACQPRKLGAGLAGHAPHADRSDLGGFEKEDVFGCAQRAALDQPPSQLERQPPQGGPASSHVEERLLSVRTEALRPAEENRSEEHTSELQSRQYLV